MRDPVVIDEIDVGDKTFRIVVDPDVRRIWFGLYDDSGNNIAPLNLEPKLADRLAAALCEAVDMRNRIQVGDKVQTPIGDVGVINTIEDDWAWVQFDRDHYSSYAPFATFNVNNLTKVDSKENS